MVEQTAIEDRLSIEAVNSLSASEFRQHFAEIFEHSPWVAEQSYGMRPFTTSANLHGAMVSVVKQAERDAQLELLRAHPELTGRFTDDSLTRHSSSEQSQAGLHHCTAEQLAQLTEYNQRYREKFDFPFIVAVKGMNVDGIISMLKARVENSEEDEFLQALEQVYRIAEFRLGEIIKN